MSKAFPRVGAEAELSKVVFDGGEALSKKRFAKGYRNPVLDKKIRMARMRSEARLLREAGAVINTPKILKTDESSSEIIMEFVDGAALKEVIEKMPALCVEAGRCIKKIHDAGIIHGDLTTSNIIFAKESNSAKIKEQINSRGVLFFIDFGLGFFSKKVEDRATDLIVFKKTFNATHSCLKNGWVMVMDGYSPDREIVSRMAAIEKRARYA